MADVSGDSLRIREGKSAAAVRTVPLHPAIDRSLALRNLAPEVTDEEWKACREYPKDLPPIA